MPKRVLFISYDGMTDPLGQSQVIPYLQGLSKAGYSIFLLSCEKKEAFQQNKQAIKKLLEESNIYWEPIRYTKTPPVISTLFDILQLKRKAKKIHQQHNLDMVHTRAGVPTLVGLWLKNKYGIKLLNDIREFYADSRVDGGMWDTNNLLYKKIYQYFKKKEEEAIIKNDGIVCLTHAAEKIIKQWPNYNAATPLQVIPCSADMDLFNAATINTAEKKSLMNKLGLQNSDLVISYLGSVGGWYLTDEMMAFCKAVIDKQPMAKFLFISPHRHDEIIEVAKKNGIPAGSVITKKASRKQVPLLLSLSSYSVFFIKPCYSKQSSSPTKHAEIMAMGIPVITNSGVGDVAEIVLQYQSGIVINEFTQVAFETAAQKVITTNNYSAGNIRNGAIEFYALEKAIKKYCTIYSQILH